MHSGKTSPITSRELGFEANSSLFVYLAVKCLFPSSIRFFSAERYWKTAMDVFRCIVVVVLHGVSSVVGPTEGSYRYPVNHRRFCYAVDIPPLLVLFFAACTQLCFDIFMYSSACDADG